MPIRPALLEFQAVLFDVDGTLIDSLFCITQGLGDTILHFCEFRPPEEELRQMVGLPLLRQMAGYAKTPAMIQPMADFAIDRMSIYLKEHKPFDAAIECLRLCHEHGLKTALVTSKNAQEIAEFLPDFSHRIYVDTAVCASDVAHPKPSPEAALLASERLGVPPANCVFVGDSIYDMRCGRDAGMTCIAVAYGASAEEALRAEQPDLLFSTPDQLLSWAQESLTSPPCPERK